MKRTHYSALHPIGNFISERVLELISKVLTIFQNWNVNQLVLVLLGRSEQLPGKHDSGGVLPAARPGQN